jgi:hypothetical protein
MTLPEVTLLLTFPATVPTMVLLRKDEAVTVHCNWDTILFPTSVVTSKHTALWSNASVLSANSGFFFFSSRFFDLGFFDLSGAVNECKGCDSET